MNDMESAEARLEQHVVEGETRVARLEQIILDLEVNEAPNAAASARTVFNLLFKSLAMMRAVLECHHAMKTSRSQT